MIIEVCLVLRIVLNEHQLFSLEHISVAPCKATRDPVNNSRDIQQVTFGTPSKKYLIPDSVSSNPHSDTSWVYKPATHEVHKMIQSSSQSNSQLKGLSNSVSNSQTNSQLNSQSSSQSNSQSNRQASSQSNHQPISQLNRKSNSQSNRQQSSQSNNKLSSHSKTPQSLTRLAKTLSFGFDPFFDKGFFEPFERRPKPVTLVAFRKNGILGTKTNIPESKSMDVAELQSPFNDISSFWLDESE